MGKIKWSCRQLEGSYIVRAERFHGDICLGVGIALPPCIWKHSTLSQRERMGLIVRLAEIELGKMARLQDSVAATPTLH